MVWRSGPLVVSLGLVFRLLASLLPIALLWIAKLIIDSIVQVVSLHQPIRPGFWWLVATEFGLAVGGSVLGRTIDYLDALLADKYTRYVSIEVMKHASALDLATYEDPVFYDRLERARVQATDRLGMIQSIGRLVQQVITAVSLSISIVLFSPWLLLLLILGVTPAFLGESHFAFLGYANNFRQTPVRRQLDYLRVLGGSREAAKELKLFGLRQFLVDRFTTLSDQLYVQNVALARRRLDRGRIPVHHRHRWILLGVCFRCLAYGHGLTHHRPIDFPLWRDRASQLEYSADFFHAGQYRRPGAFPH